MFNNTVMISIKPRWCRLIETGEKLDEIRKTVPRRRNYIPIRVFIYETGGLGVIGEFVMRFATYIYARVYENGEKHLYNTALLRSCVPDQELFKYLYRKDKEYPDGWAWHIEDLVIYDKPRPITDYGLKRPPQSWCYVRKK